MIKRKVNRSSLGDGGVTQVAKVHQARAALARVDDRRDRLCAEVGCSAFSAWITNQCRGAATSPGGGAAGCFPCATAPRVYAAAPRRGWCATHCWRSRPRPCTWSRHQTREGRGAGGVRGRGRRLRLMQRARRLRLRCAPAATVLARARCKHSDSADVGSSAGSTPAAASTALTACSKAGRAAAESGAIWQPDLAAAERPAPLVPAAHVAQVELLNVRHFGWACAAAGAAGGLIGRSAACAAGGGAGDAG